MRPLRTASTASIAVLEAQLAEEIVRRKHLERDELSRSTWPASTRGARGITAPPATAVT
jgi:hypothetical protein